MITSRTKENLKHVGTIVGVSVIEVSKGYAVLLAVCGTIYVGSTLLHKAKEKLKARAEVRSKKAA